MKILYVLYFNIDDTNQLGIVKKINYQINSMKKCGHVVHVGYCNSNKFCILYKENKIKKYKAPDGITHYRKSIRDILKKISNKYDLIYIRYPGSIDYYLYSTFKSIKEKSVDVILEMPTYPIGGEMTNNLKLLINQKKYLRFIQKAIVYLIHRILSRKISPFLKCIVSYSQFEKIWGTKVINIENGIDCSSITPKKIVSKNDNCVRLIFVAVFDIWHGLDRVIDGLSEYYNNNNKQDVELTLIGQSQELEKIKQSDSYKRNYSHIRALGSVFGDALNEEYNRADIAISSLGMHRIGLLQGSTLKTREYCAKGIPFVYGYYEKEIDDTFPYALRVEANDAPLNINRIIQFYNRIKNDNYISEMRKFALRYDWDKQMQHLFEELSAIED